MNNSIIVFTDPESDTTTQGPKLLNKGQDKGRGAPKVALKTIQKNLSEFVDSLEGLIPAAKETPEGFRLKSFQVAVGVNGKGQVGFLGTGSEAGASATLTLSFER